MRSRSWTTSTTFPLAAIGPLVERDDAFPERVNFEIVEVQAAVEAQGPRMGAGRGSDAGLWLRRVGIHGGRGRRGQSASPGGVSLDMPGGKLMAEWSGEGQETVLEGPASTVFVGEWADR